MKVDPRVLTDAFRALSARLGQDPLQVQGPGGNTSIKSDDVMWIKASGTELANATRDDIFVPVDLAKARAEANGAGDGSCKDTVIDPTCTLRPSIETTFHAALPGKVVAHTHSVATLVHAISPEGRQSAHNKLAGLPFVMVPYAKPGLPLTRLILEAVQPDTRIVVLQNHGLVVTGNTVEDVSETLAEVEARLAMPNLHGAQCTASETAPKGYHWATESWIAQNPTVMQTVLVGSYYPDHVVFLGAALPNEDTSNSDPAVLFKGQGIALRDKATSSQKAMLRCLSDVLSRVPNTWQLDTIGIEAEAELLNWDAEKYRQALADRG